jgi:predicted nucleotide-binding protein (sugar kinase/HSP70/actin superfamily)
VQELAGLVDIVFIPSIRSLEPNVYNCSKFLGLPDLVRNTVPGCPPVIDMEIDVNKGMKKVREEIHSLGKNFTRDSKAIDRAWQAAQEADREYHRILSGGLNPPQAIAKLLGEDMPENAGEGKGDVRVAVVGHPYNIYDGYINHNLLQRMVKLGARVSTAEDVTGAALDAGTARLVGKPYWTYEDEVVGAAGHYLSDGADGVMVVVSFGCGPDSLMVDVVQRAAKRMANVPLSVITLDEHTGEAGLLTRLEAFVDMLRRRRQRRSAGQSAA